MQNLGLLQICLSFPTLPNIESYKQVAMERMHDQINFLVNSEGVVLEHSAGYQRTGHKFIDMAFKYMTLLNLSIPNDWVAKYQKAKDFYTQLKRPDGSLPMFGDTGNGGKNPAMFAGNRGANGNSKRLIEMIDTKKWVLPKPHSLFPVAGYSIWWDGIDKLQNETELSQTVVVWSYFPGHAHKHADEMSVLLWYNGHNWWTNIGYWPFGAKGRSKAMSWAGSNAPHLLNENEKSIRSSKLLSFGWSNNLAIIDIERKGPDGYKARRQVLHAKPNLWLVLDHTFGNEDHWTTTTWTTSSHIKLLKGELPGSYILEPDESNLKLFKFLLTSESAVIKQYKGSFSPFAGWEINKPASAIVLKQPANDSWAAAVWLITESNSNSNQFKDRPFMESWKSPVDWQLILKLCSGTMKISRQSNQISLLKYNTGKTKKTDLRLLKPPIVEEKIEKLHVAYDFAKKKYPKKHYSLPRRIKVSYIIVFLFMMQEVFFLIYRRLLNKSYLRLRLLNFVGWIIVGTLLMTAYL
jgi:hypothetical protein